MRCTTPLVTLSLAITATAGTIDIPADYPTIQAGIDVAIEGDTVLVHPGTYFETEIGFHGKAILVSSLDPDDSLTVATTVVSGGGSERPFHFQAGEERSSVLAGLTITGGGIRGVAECSAPGVLRRSIAAES